MAITKTKFDDAIFESVTPNYHRKVLQIVLRHGTKQQTYRLPFSVFKGLSISTQNKFATLNICNELDKKAVEFTLQNGKHGDFPTDFVLYHCEPDYEWAPLNQVKTALKETLRQSGISLRTVADALKTSPVQVMRLFKTNQMAKQWLQLGQVARVLGYRIELKLKKQ